MDRNNVGREVLDSSNSRFRGSMDTIQKWIQGFDYIFQCFVTFIGFGIICAAIGKNCLAGLYCTFPKFFDKVDQAHKDYENQGWIDQIKGLKSSYSQINGSTIGKNLLRLVPNIKTITDFEDSTVSAKDYFFKAIPLMCVAIIIGGFIYNGFHADVGAKITDFGSELFYRTIMATDPIEVFDRMTGSLVRPTFASQGSDVTSDKMVANLSEDAYAAIRSRWPDIKGKTTVQTLAANIETWVQTTCEKSGLYSKLEAEPNAWKVATEAKIIEKPINLDAYRKKAQVGEDTVLMWADSIEIMDGLGVKDMTAKDDQEAHYLLIIAKCTKISEKVVRGQAMDIVLYTPVEIKDESLYIYLGGVGGSVNGTGAWTFTNGAKVTVSKGDKSTSGTYKDSIIIVKNYKDVFGSDTNNVTQAGTFKISNLKWRAGSATSVVATCKTKGKGDASDMQNAVTWESSTYDIGEWPGQKAEFTMKKTKVKNDGKTTSKSN